MKVKINFAITFFLIIVSIIFPNSIFGINNIPFDESEISILTNLRLKYYQAVEDEDYLDELESFVKNEIPKREKFKVYSIAYSGGIAAVKSKHAFWPMKKLNYLKESLRFLNQAIEMDPDNLEIRFMRFSILHYVPSFLGYNSEKENDAAVIVKLLMRKDYSILDSEIQKGIAEFMINSKRLDDNSILSLRNELTYLKSK